MALLIRSWNVFHGRTWPSGRRAYLRPAIELVTQDEPDIVCLQELPRWSLGRLEQWSGMTVFGAPTRRGLGRVARRLTDLHHAILRSSVSGQANAILVARSWDASDCGQVILNPGRPGEPRVCHGVRIAVDDHVTMVVVNVHCSHHGGGAPAGDELARAVAFADEVSGPGEPVVLAGDLNLTAESAAVRKVTGGGGFSAAGPGIDHILVRGAPSSGLVVWAVERRTVAGRVLSDHPPVELSVGEP